MKASIIGADPRELEDSFLVQRREMTDDSTYQTDFDDEELLRTMKATTTFEKVRLACLLSCAGCLVPANIRAKRPVVTQTRVDEALIRAPSGSLSKQARTRKDLLKSLPEFQFDAKVVKDLVAKVHGQAGAGAQEGESDDGSSVTGGKGGRCTQDVYMPWFEKECPAKFDKNPKCDGMPESELVRRESSKNLTKKQVARRTKLRKMIRDQCRQSLLRDEDPVAFRKKSAEDRARQRRG